MDQTKSIELQKKRLESAEERARARFKCMCTNPLMHMIKVVQWRMFLINRSVLSPPPSRFYYFF